MTRLALIVACCSLGAGTAGAASSSSKLAHCRPGQLTLAGSLQGATQSLLGTLTVTNHSGTACALPGWPSRVALRVGKQVLPALTVHMSPGVEPPGPARRKLPAHAGVFVGIQWRNWCGRPRGDVHLSISLAIYLAAPRVGVGAVQTPVCVNHKYSSRVAVSRFKAPTP
jgi:Protein of unknown function (DUF4232)